MRLDLEAEPHDDRLPGDQLVVASVIIHSMDLDFEELDPATMTWREAEHLAAEDRRALMTLQMSMLVKRVIRFHTIRIERGHPCHSVLMNLTSRQLALLRTWVGEWHLVADLSWPLQDTKVLRITGGGNDLVVKASATSHHIQREIWAHDGHLSHMTGVVPELLHADNEAGILVTRYLPGNLVLGAPDERSATIYRQAGVLLARFMVGMGDSGDYMSHHIEKARGLIDRAAGLAPVSHLRRARRDLDAMLPMTVPLVLTHGDYQPRNWLHSASGELLLIDFGRAAPRHWTSELPRLESRAFDDRTLRDAFFDGLGFEPASEDAAVHHLERLGMAVGTIVWAHDIGDHAFEEEGRGMLERALAA